MHEHTFRGVGFALAKREDVEPGEDEWQLVIIDAAVDGAGNIIPGSGSGEVYRFLMDGPAVAALHEQSEGASKIAVPGQAPITVVRGREPAVG